MDYEKTGNVIGLIVFGLVGLCALITALFYDAPHQFFTAGIAAFMSLGFINELNRNK